jgi:ketosteroid isomerase-like protein
MMVNGLEIPRALQLQGKKPWEIIHQDTMEMWKFGDRRSFTSLELLAELLGIPGAKSDLSGDRVHAVYFQDHDLPRITAYCMEDVIVVAQLYLRFHFMELVEPHNIEKL